MAAIAFRLVFITVLRMAIGVGHICVMEKQRNASRPGMIEVRRLPAGRWRAGSCRASGRTGSGTGCCPRDRRRSWWPPRGRRFPRPRVCGSRGRCRGAARGGLRRRLLADVLARHDVAVANGDVTSGVELLRELSEAEFDRSNRVGQSAFAEFRGRIREPCPAA